MCDSSTDKGTSAGGDAPWWRNDPEFREAVWRYAFRRTGSPRWAKELTDETFTRADVAAAADRSPRFRSWFYEVLGNLFKDDLGRKGTAEKHEDKLGRHVHGLLELRWPLGPLQQAVVTEEIDAVRRALGQLSPKHRYVLKLRYVDGCTYKEIGSIIGRSDRAVCGLLERALRKLRSLLGGMH